MENSVVDQAGCGSGGCACASVAARPVIRVNGIVVPAADDDALEDVRERVYAELLRQEAVRLGRLPSLAGEVAPEADAATRAAIETMLDETVTTPEPSDEACRRYYAAHQRHYVVGQALRVRHILFAVTPGVNVQALAQRAEAALLELSHKRVDAGRFAALAAQLSNCPSGASGGDLGWITPQDCAPELTRELFLQNEVALGVQPRLVHSRHGLHIVDVLERRPGRLPSFDEVRQRIVMQLVTQARATALRHTMMALVSGAHIEGIVLDGAATPLVQ